MESHEHEAVAKNIVLDCVPEERRSDATTYLARYRLAMRAATFNEAVLLLEKIASIQDCFDDAEMQRQAEETSSCARALRIHVASVMAAEEEMTP